MILTSGGWQTFILFYLRPQSFKMSIHTPLLVSKMMVDSIPMICTPRISENQFFWLHVANLRISKIFLHRIKILISKIYCSMASYSVNSPQKNRELRVEWQFCIGWFCDSRTVGLLGTLHTKFGTRD